jgi:hypothetical protein
VKRAYLTTDAHRSMAYLALSLAARGLHAALQVYCAERETGGMLAGAATYTAQQWFAAGGKGANRRAIDELVRLGLARWEGADLKVAHYDADSEQLYRSKREAARKGGEAPREPRGGKPQPLSGAEPSSAPSSASSIPAEESRAEASRAGQGEDPFALVLAFESAWRAKVFGAYETTDADYALVAELWPRHGPEDRAALPGRISTYLTSDQGDTLSGFCEAELAALPRAHRGAA